MLDTAHRLYPILRSITGNGVRQTLSILQEVIPDMKQVEVPTGTPVLDWTVPREWNCRAAWLKGPDGKTIVDLKENTLHILNYSVPVQGSFSWEELRPHLFSLPDQPDLIPYRTSYYAENWGFCLPHSLLETLPTEGQYEVFIDSTLEEGSLTYGELYLPGQSQEEVFFSTHICHPSLANDNVSGMVVAAQLGAWLAAQPNRKYSYRIVFVPGTIGAISWLAQNRAVVPKVRYALVLSLLGDSSPFTYKPSREGNTATDRLLRRVLKASGQTHREIDFYPYGYDERQYGSPGFNMPVGRLSRSLHGAFAEYHTSADNLSFISDENLQGSLGLLKEFCRAAEEEVFYQNLEPYGEPQLGRRGLYRAIAGTEAKASEMAILWLLSHSDGQYSLKDIAERSGTTLEELRRVAGLLVEAGLLKELKAKN